ncbi:hypothetical protein [Spirochaeta isovalerica]|uniref:Cellobiose phosphorylase n=1 Tax=Spirochaeta isovalerica TaxID=150 RepID=A0A841R7D5_9SPIO|nr:hypothetical protein [Spirochaeta isovalerica]MBB6479291.1 hypothetical protein [Spirochaeta isovalerica]
MNVRRQVFLGDQPFINEQFQVEEGFCDREGEIYYKIENYTAMEPFFMTVTSDSNHWMFISSTGGLTAGRVNSEFSLFPYYTDDRITENTGNTGPATVILAEKGDKKFLWEPFCRESGRVYTVHLNLYRNVRGNRVIFEEVNETLGLSFSYMWMNSRRFGWVKKSILKNNSGECVNIELTDGVMNIIPAGTSSHIQNTFGNLLNAYKKSEIDRETGLGLFALSATLTDLAEPSESLKANVFWQWGLDVSYYLLNEKQLAKISSGSKAEPEWVNKGDRGGYFVGSSFALDKGEEKVWYLSGDVDKDHSAVESLRSMLLDSGFDGSREIEEDAAEGNRKLDEILALNDGMQKSAGVMNCAHHQANVLYNIMRGGYFFNGNTIPVADFVEYIHSTNKQVCALYEESLLKLGETAEYGQVLDFVLSRHDVNLTRLWYEYLPLSFSRRHGDPSRPWNVFSIETEKADGSPKLDYQGNWRDIFQNWEALSYSYPLFIRHMVGKFLNATTADGYNPYRLSRSGIDWEVPEPGNPWANIGYWSDHQIIYLLKLLEMYRNFFGDRILADLDSREFTFAEVPYEIKSFDEILKDPYNTIVFNENKHKIILERTEQVGAEGKMLHTSEGSIVLASMTEKLMILLLAKLGNFVPGGGIWMNTQRPEWNDANNALVGKGVSIVTLAYVRRFAAFLLGIFQSHDSGSSFTVHKDVHDWFTAISEVMSRIDSMKESVNPEERLDVVSRLGRASERYRSSLYERGRTEERETLSRDRLIEFLSTSLRCIDQTLGENRRDDDLFHSYNTLEIRTDGLKIHYLYEMLEGQVAVLSANWLEPAESLKMLEALRGSSLYRPDQNSYMLYPNRTLPGFLEKNNIDRESVKSSVLLSTLIEEGNKDLILMDSKGICHFNGDFHNARQVGDVLNKLSREVKYAGLVEKERDSIEHLFEATFNHQSFTGRSGTFFAYEGLGSIYWHMVSKLLLAVQENLFRAVDGGVSADVIESLKKHYYDVRAGIGYNKPATVYGAFPFDPYSHSPEGKGAKQPGMTGQVKEEVITRLAETGIRIIDGKIAFDGTLIDPQELFSGDETWQLVTAGGQTRRMTLPRNSMGLTFCDTPFVIGKGDKASIKVFFTDGETETIIGSVLPGEYCKSIYSRDNTISQLEVTVL